ncbi:aldo/keto reductase [uncultured Enterovirga sp.]|uniref:aldo/keto reductase n=1 Tax=uncultured Enterovirga sp. TaxID=2026352 RepID=UPI0035CC3180
MRYNNLGQTGLLVSELCLGTMTFGGTGEVWSKIGDLGQSEADALIKVALDGGINFLDTADVYSEGRSEEITGQAIKNLGIAREDVVVATKGFGRVGSAPGPNRVGASRAHILQACKNSLRRLRLDHVDLYQLHGFDAATPVEEMLEALDVLVRHGHVRYVGVSNWAAWQVAKALGIAERKNLAPPRILQSYYTLAGRDLEREIVPMLLSEKVGLMVWSPLAGGLLSGKYDLDEADDTTQGTGRRASFDFPPVERPRARAAVVVLREIAGEKGCSVAQVALAWLLHQPVVTSVIVGAKRPDQLADNLGAVDVVLTDDDLARLDAASALPKEYPGWMIERQAGLRPKQGGRRAG